METSTKSELTQHSNQPSQSSKHHITWCPTWCAPHETEQSGEYLDPEMTSWLCKDTPLPALDNLPRQLSVPACPPECGDQPDCI